MKTERQYHDSLKDAAEEQVRQDQQKQASDDIYWMRGENWIARAPIKFKRQQ